MEKEDGPEEPEESIPVTSAPGLKNDNKSLVTNANAKLPAVS